MSLCVGLSCARCQSLFFVWCLFFYCRLDRTNQTFELCGESFYSVSWWEVLGRVLQLNFSGNIFHEKPQTLTTAVDVLVELFCSLPADFFFAFLLAHLFSHIYIQSPAATSDIDVVIPMENRYIY